MDENEIRHLAKLAKLSLTDEEVTKFATDMKDILNFANQINQINTDGVNASSTSQEMCNVFREDVVNKSTCREKLLQNCETVEDGMFKIPKTIN